MTGLPNNNLDAFNAQAKYWRALGLNIKNPAEFSSDGCSTYAQWLKRDLHILMNECNALMLMPGWEKSKGATTEKKVAEALDYPILAAGLIEEDNTMLYTEPETVCQIADRLTSEDRQKTYGHPTEDFTRQANILNSLGYRYMPPNGPLRLLQARDIPMLMITAKMSRLVNSEFEHRDSIIDIAGYAKCLDQVNQCQKI